MTGTDRGRPSRTAARLLAAGVPALVLVGVAAGPSEAAAAVGCGVSVVATDRVDGQSGLLVTAPPAPARLAAPTGAFHLVQGGRQLPASVTAVAPGDVAVAVVVASSAQTSAEAFQTARDGAVELLVALPPEARTAVVSSGQARPLAALSVARASSTQSLRPARPGAGDSGPAAALRAAALLPRGGHVVLLSDGSSEGTAAEVQSLTRTLQQRGLVLDRVGYGTTTQAAPAATACPTTADPVLPQVDQTAAAISHQYRVQAVLDPAQPATLTVDQVGAVTVAAVGGSAHTTSPYAADESAGRADLGYGVAAGLGLVGLLLLLLRGRRPGGPPAGPPVEQWDAARTPVASGRS